jgi:hypothetical protein
LRAHATSVARLSGNEQSLRQNSWRSNWHELCSDRGMIFETIPDSTGVARKRTAVSLSAFGQMLSGVGQ